MGQEVSEGGGLGRNLRARNDPTGLKWLFPCSYGTRDDSREASKATLSFNGYHRLMRDKLKSNLTFPR